MNVGFIGAGQIGLPMVERLLAAGHRVRLYARRPEVRERASLAGAEIVDRPSEVSEAEVVVSCLYSDAQMLDVLPQVVRAMGPDTVLLSHTTGTPGALERLAQCGHSAKAAIVDGAFSGTADAVRAGRLVVYLGGEPEHVAAVQPVVTAYADPVINSGVRGSALKMKLLNNLLFAAITQQTLRTLQAGSALGLRQAALLDVLAVSSGGSKAAQYLTDRGGPEQYVAAVAPFLRKDLAACRDVAAEAGVDLSDLLAAAHDGPMNLDVPSSQNGVI